MPRWSEETTLKFVNAYVKQESLWNVKSPLYKNKGAKAAAIIELEQVMGIPGFGQKEIRKKIKNIRSTYSQELKKMKNSKLSGAGADTAYLPNVKWFTILNERLQNLHMEMTRRESYLANESDLDLNEDTDDSKIPTSSRVEVTLSETNFRPPTPVNRGKKKQKLSELKTMMSKLKEMTYSASSLADENEFDVFGKHVAVQLKSLPLLPALEAQEHIQIYLNRIRRHHIMQNSATFSTRNRTGTTTRTLMDSPLPSPPSYDSYNLQSPQSAVCKGEPLFTGRKGGANSGSHETSQDDSHSSDSDRSVDVIALAMNDADVNFNEMSDS